MKFNKDDAYAIAASIVLHLILLFLLSVGVLSTMVPEEERILIALVDEFSDVKGTPAADSPPPAVSAERNTSSPTPARSATTPARTTTTPARTTTTPAARTTTSPQATTPNPEKTSNEKAVTQDKEESVSIPDNSKQAETTEDNEPAQKEKEEADRKRIEEEQAKRIEDQMSRSFQGSGSQTGTQGNSSSGTSPQGNPFNTPGSGTSQGSGVAGSFSLGNRSISGGGLPTPGDKGQDVGKIVINITVDPKGKVIAAEIGRGTNITDSSMRNSALEAAKRAQFNTIQRPDNQTGTITYIYTTKQT